MKLYVYLALSLFTMQSLYYQGKGSKKYGALLIIEL